MNDGIRASQLNVAGTGTENTLGKRSLPQQFHKPQSSQRGVMSTLMAAVPTGGKEE